MVQYNTGPDFWQRETPRFDNNHYWKLSVVPDADLASPSGTKGDGCFRHFQKHSRQQRGMLTYDYCSDDELRRFCVQRGLQTEDSCGSREDMINELEQADDWDTPFARFLDLLPELRLRVYQFYRASLGQSFLPYFTAPPIMSVSKLIRQEAASVFFRDHMFMCSLDRIQYGSNNMPRRRLYLDRVTRLFFKNAPLIFLKSVRRLQVWSSLPEPKVGMSYGNGYAEWLIDLRLKSRDSRVVFEGIGTYTRVRQSQAEQDAIVKLVTERLRDVVDTIVTRGPLLALRREDDVPILAALDTLPEKLAEV